MGSGEGPVPSTGAFGRNQPADRQTGKLGRGEMGECLWRETDVAYFWPEPVW